MDLAWVLFSGWPTPNLANGLISWKPWDGPWDQVRGGLELVGAVPGSRFGVGRARVGWKLGGELGVTPLKTRVGSVLRRLYSQIGFAWDQKVSHGFFLAIGRGFGPKTMANKKKYQGFLRIGIFLADFHTY